MIIDVEKIRQDFPILHQNIHGKPFAYLDNSATTQKPQCVIDAVTNFYSFENSNIHRGVHHLSQKATEKYENAREIVRNFVNAKEKHEIIFTKGTTEAINLVAFSFGEAFVNEGDEILISEMEHHSNIVPWQMLCERKKAILKVIPFDENGDLILDEYDKLLSHRTKIVSIVFVSNSLGTINPVKEIIAKAHAKNIPVMLDAAQAVQHIPIDVQDIDCDFMAFSGHKLYAENGIGVLYGKEKWLDLMPPYQGGGDMIKTVSFAKTVYNVLPFKFEAGTINYVGAISMGVAINYLNSIGLQNIADYENSLLNYATQKLQQIDNLTIYGKAKHKAGAVSFLLKGIHFFDAGMIIDKLGIAVRTGTHCTQPVMEHFGIEGTVRASFSFYNTKEEIDYLTAAVEKVNNMFN